jgi:hypothetical protein
VELVNYDVEPVTSRVYGLCPVPDMSMMILRHQKSSSLLSLDGDIKNTWFSEHEVNDVAVQKEYSTIAQIDRSGTLKMLSLDSFEPLDVFERKFFSRTRNFNWATLGLHETPSSLRVATRKEVSLFDVRMGKDGIVFYPHNPDPGFEVVCGITKSHKRSCLFYVSTSDGVHLVDERNNKVDVNNIQKIHSS